MNKVILIGRLVRDPEMRTTGSGTSVTSFTIAVSRPFTSQNSNDKPQADFIGCIAWRKLAENIAKYCSKGSMIAVAGHINTSSYDGQDGQRHYRTDIVADSVTFLDGKNKQQNGQQGGQETGQQNVQEDPFKDFGEEIQLSDDDLPF